jgi:hypothetical protein
MRQVRTAKAKVAQFVFDQSLLRRSQPREARGGAQRRIARVQSGILTQPRGKLGNHLQPGVVRLTQFRGVDDCVDMCDNAQARSSRSVAANCGATIGFPRSGLVARDDLFDRCADLVDQRSQRRALCARRARRQTGAIRKNPAADS